jgi:hypothetical protein
MAGRIKTLRRAPPADDLASLTKRFFVEGFVSHLQISKRTVLSFIETAESAGNAEETNNPLVDFHSLHCGTSPRLRP